MQDCKRELTLIMPVYNAGDTVRHSIDSYIELKRQADIQVQLIVVDDASTDNSFELLQSYLADCSSATLLKCSVNSGPGAARNRALEIVRRGYIGFIDADDLLLPETYLKVFNEGVDNAAEWITFNGNVVSGQQSAPRYDLDRLTDDDELMVRRCMKAEFDGSVIFSIYSVSLIERLKLRFPKGVYEDILFAYSAMLLSDNRYRTEQVAYQKNNREGSIVNSISNRHIEGMLNSCLQVRRRVIASQLSSYKEFEDDFSYGLFGYVHTLLQSIIKSSSSISEKLGLMDELYRRYCQIPEFAGVMERESSHKDRVVSRFLWCWSNNLEKVQFIRDYQ